MKHVIEHVEDLCSKVQQRYLNRAERLSPTEIRFMYGQVDAYTEVLAFLETLETKPARQDLLADKMRELSEKNKFSSHEDAIEIVALKIQQSAKSGLRQCFCGYLPTEVVDYFRQQGFIVKELTRNRCKDIVFQW